MSTSKKNSLSPKNSRKTYKLTESQESVRLLDFLRFVSATVQVLTPFRYPIRRVEGYV